MSKEDPNEEDMPLLIICHNLVNTVINNFTMTINSEINLSRFIPVEHRNFMIA